MNEADPRIVETEFCLDHMVGERPEASDLVALLIGEEFSTQTDGLAYN